MKYRLVLSVMAFTLVASCGGSSKSAPKTTSTAPPVPTETSTTPTTAAPQSTSLNPCELVPLDDAKALIGTTLNAGVLAGPEGEQGCTYSGPPTGPTAQVEVYAGPGAKKYYDVDVTLGHTFTNETGIGDEAYYEEFHIFFRKGENWVAVTLTSLDDPAKFKPRLEELAKQVAAKL